MKHQTSMSPKFTAGADALTWLPNTMPESDVLPHIEDTPLVNAIRDGKLVEVRWNRLTDEEQRQARARMFDLRSEYDW